MLRNREELQILEKKITNLEKKVKKLKAENEKLRKAKLMAYRKSKESREDGQ